MMAFMLANWYWILLAIAAMFLIGVLAACIGGVKKVLWIIFLPLILLVNVIIFLFALLFRKREK